MAIGAAGIRRVAGVSVGSAPSAVDRQSKAGLGAPGQALHVETGFGGGLGKGPLATSRVLVSSGHHEARPRREG